MKQRSILIATIAILFASCNSDYSRQRTAKGQDDIVTTPTVIEKHDTPTTPPKETSADFAFWAKKVEVKPMVINENDTWGEGQEPARSISYTFYFTDSLGNTKEWVMYDAVLKGKYPDSAQKEKDLERFAKALTLYKEVANADIGRLYVQGSFNLVKVLSKGVDLKQKKIGNAIIKEDAVVELWSQYTWY